MAHRITRAALAAAVAVIVSLTAFNGALADTYGPQGWTSPEPNYYATPAAEGGLTAAMYPCPRPTPPLVGQTYITYQPLAPQNFMWMHYNYYSTSHSGGQSTTTSVTYGHRFNFHPSLRNQAVGLHTPASGCSF